MIITNIMTEFMIMFNNAIMIIVSNIAESAQVWPLLVFACLNNAPTSG